MNIHSASATHGAVLIREARKTLETDKAAADAAVAAALAEGTRLAVEPMSVPPPLSEGQVANVVNATRRLAEATAAQARAAAALDALDAVEAEFTDVVGG